MVDGLSQENLLNGAKCLISPLTKIINQSIKEGQFPSEWREALVTPVLKKGTQNYCQTIGWSAVFWQPQSCLSTESLMKLVGGLFMSKIRYGLQLLGKVRLNELDPVNKKSKISS